MTADRSPLVTDPTREVPEPAPKVCPGCGHSFHPAGRCTYEYGCVCQTNMAVELEFRPQPETRKAHDVLVSIAQLGEEQLAALKHLVARTSSGESRSSASVKSSARGYDLDCKSYADGLEDEALDNAIAMYARGMRELDALKANDWKQTVDGFAERATS